MEAVLQLCTFVIKLVIGPCTDGKPGLMLTVRVDSQADREAISDNDSEVDSAVYSETDSEIDSECVDRQHCMCVSVCITAGPWCLHYWMSCARLACCMCWWWWGASYLLK
jgi:hypothetical protein